MLPNGVEDLFQKRAFAIEQIRDKLRKNLQSWGYEQVIPAMFESLESLEVTNNSELIDSSFKFTDPLTGKIIALRVDMTTQVARMDARSNHANIARFFYVGHIFRGKNKHYKNSRTPIQLGAEIYGHSGIESDIEIIELMIELLSSCGYQNLLLDIGHIGVLNKIINPIAADLTIDKTALLEVIKKKSLSDLALLIDSKLSQYKEIKDLMSLIGDSKVLTRISKRFKVIDSEVKQIQKLVKTIEARISKKIKINWHIDLSNLQSYLYHNGLVFNVLDMNDQVYLAKGGRYDNIGKPFGISRPATGFSMFIDQLKKLDEPAIEKIFISFDCLSAPNLSNEINKIKMEFSSKNKQTQFIRALNQSNEASDYKCNYSLELINNKLELKKI